jgi:hypothetical protein
MRRNARSVGDRAAPSVDVICSTDLEVTRFDDFGCCFAADFGDDRKQGRAERFEVLQSIPDVDDSHYVLLLEPDVREPTLRMIRRLITKKPLNRIVLCRCEVRRERDRECRW